MKKMGFKPKAVKYSFRKLPLHTYEAHPAAASGEIKKPFVTAIIVVASIIILSVLLLFSEQIFVGKAYTGVANTAGIGDVLVVPNTPFSAIVQANIGTAETVAVGFTLNLPAGISCITVQSLLGWNQTTGAVFETARCDNQNNQVVFEYATLDTAVSHRGQFDIARIDFSGAVAGNYNLQFPLFEVVDLATLNNIVTPVTATFIVTSASGSVCGNSLIEVNAIGPDELCDDGNIISGDGCSSTCLNIESGYTCVGQPSACTLVVAAACGDGILNAGESCDDANIVNGDGCSSTCTVEAGYTCSAGQPTLCTPTITIQQGTYTTTITATANTVQSTIYTTLLTNTREILVFKSERVPAMTAGQTYTSTVTYPFSSQVMTKEVLVQDVPPNQGRTVYAFQTDDVTVAGSITVTGTKIMVR